MRQRLAARGRSWDEFIGLLANLRLDEEDRKEKDKKKATQPILPPPVVLAEWERRRKENKTEAT